MLRKYNLNWTCKPKNCCKTAYRPSPINQLKCVIKISKTVWNTCGFVRTLMNDRCYLRSSDLQAGSRCLTFWAAFISETSCYLKAAAASSEHLIFLIPLSKCLILFLFSLNESNYSTKDARLVHLFQEKGQWKLDCICLYFLYLLWKEHKCSFLLCL